MSKFDWSEKYSVGIKQMDEEHKKLVGLMQQLDAETSGNQNESVVAEVMDGLIDYIRTHFVSEEKLMKENDFPGFLAHRQVHIEFIRTVVELRNNHANKHFDKDRISVFLIEWLLKHIMGMDKQYGKYLLRRA